MREIKFRAWDKLNNRMIYLDSSYSDNVLVIDKYGWRIGEADYDWGFTGSQARSEENDFLMQFTGLKDSEGTEIWESDLVVFEPEGFPYEVAFLDGGFVLRSRHTVPIEYPLGKFSNDVKVIGNIHSNPELLKVTPE